MTIAARRPRGRVPSLNLAQGIVACMSDDEFSLLLLHARQQWFNSSIRQLPQGNDAVPSHERIVISFEDTNQLLHRRRVPEIPQRHRTRLPYTLIEIIMQCLDQRRKDGNCAYLAKRDRGLLSHKTRRVINKGVPQWFNAIYGAPPAEEECRGPTNQ